MPFKSEAQRRYFHAAQARGEIPKSTVKRWEEHTPKGKKLPEHVRKKEAGMRKNAAFMAGVVAATEDLYHHLVTEKIAARDMPHFTDQNRPESVKKIYKALKREHPRMAAGEKARIAARQGKPGKQHQGPPYKGPLSG